MEVLSACKMTLGDGGAFSYTRSPYCLHTASILLLHPVLASAAGLLYNTGPPYSLRTVRTEPCAARL